MRHSYLRKRPDGGVMPDETLPTVVFLTVCTKRKQPWLASREAHDLLKMIWSSARAWEVGPYVLMPDHIHLFASPGRQTRTLDRWVAYWKSLFTFRFRNESFRWQRYSFHHRLRSYESAESKWEYIRQNPVRAGLVNEPADWPYQGEIFPSLYWW
jgi:putative transposase